MWLWTTSGSNGGQLVGQGPDGQPIVGLVDDGRFDAGLLQPPDAAAVRQRNDPDVVAGRVQPRHEREDVLLRAAVRAGGHDLDDAHPPAGEWPAHILIRAGSDRRPSRRPR